MYVMCTVCTGAVGQRSAAAPTGLPAAGRRDREDRPQDAGGTIPKHGAVGKDNIRPYGHTCVNESWHTMTCVYMHSLCS